MTKPEELIRLINTKHPEWKNLTVRDLVIESGYKHDTCYKAYKAVRANGDQTKKHTKKNMPIPPQISIGKGEEAPSPKFINRLENPVKAVQDLIVDELWKTRDVRWAKLFVDILRDTKKLDYDTIKEEEWQHQAQSMELSELVELVVKKGSTTRSTSRRLDALEDTSPYENI